MNRRKKRILRREKLRRCDVGKVRRRKKRDFKTPAMIAKAKIRSRKGSLRKKEDKSRKQRDQRRRLEDARKLRKPESWFKKILLWFRRMVRVWGR